MRDFCHLYWNLDSTNRTSEKVRHIKEYLGDVEPADAIWAIWFLTGNRLKRLVPMKMFRQWAIEHCGISNWLFEECYDRVGDLAETISLLLNAQKPESPLCVQTNLTPNESSASLSLAVLVQEHLKPLRQADAARQRETVVALWRKLNQPEVFVLGKLVTGGFRVGVSKKLVVRAIAESSGVDVATIAHRMMGTWEPTVEFYESLIDPDDRATAISKPYPFFLANPIKDGPDLTLGGPEHWIAEWKWDGVRAQLIRRGGETFIWSRGEDLVTDQFPEIVSAADRLPDGTVLDGEIVGWSESENRPLEFSQLQRRLGRKKVGRKLLGEVPVFMLAFDLLEHHGVDIRGATLADRQQQLLEVLNASHEPLPHDDKGQASEPVQAMLFPDLDETQHTISQRGVDRIRFPPELECSGQFETWAQLATLREQAKSLRAEGVMLKRRDSTYQVGRPIGDWWKWKVDPFTIDAVLIYAQRGHGRRASLYTDYTFAVWDNEQLVPFAKAYSGLTDAEIAKVDAYVRKNTTEKFGPVRSVTPNLVFELAFENIQRSTRHKSGIAVRFPRISRWRHDKRPADADSLSTILAMIDGA